jgi:hypothetical protein
MIIDTATYGYAPRWSAVGATTSTTPTLIEGSDANARFGTRQDAAAIRHALIIRVFGRGPMA